MRRMLILFAATIVTGLSLTTPAPAAANRAFRVYSATEREAIRAMPIEQRPNRPGHFYGNTVRRLKGLGL